MNARRVVEVPQEKWLLENNEDVYQYGAEIAERINADRSLGILFFVDPVRSLEEAGFQVEHNFRSEVRKSVFGASREQNEEYERVKERLAAGEETVSGIRSVTFRFHEAGARPTATAREGWSRANSDSPNPIGDFDTVLELHEPLIEKITQVAYDEGVFPHRFNIPATMASLGSEIVLGRPKALTLDTQQPNFVKIQFPFAVVQSGQVKRGVITAEAALKIELQNGKPVWLAADFNVWQNIDVQSVDLDENGKLLLKTGIGLMLATKTVPLSPMIKELANYGVYLEDLKYKTINLANPNARDTMFICANFSPNNGKGDLKNVSQFAKQDWAIGANQRFIVGKFNQWWNDPNSSAKKYRRLNRGKLEKYQSLGSNFDQIFDPNGDITIGTVAFSFEQGYLQFSADITVEDAFMWFDVDLTISGKVKLSINPQNNMMLLNVEDVDSSVSCWSKFIIALFFMAVGFIGGAIIGGIVGGVVGGVVGAGVGVSIGASLSTMAAGVIGGVILPALAQAAINNQLQSLKDLELIKMAYAWQIPNTTLVINAAALWLEVKKGEILLGGKVITPPLDLPAISIQTQKSSTIKTDIMVDNKPKYYLVDSEITLAAQIDQALEKPMENTWKLGSTTLTGNGDKIVITVKPVITQTLAPKSIKMEDYSSTLGKTGPIISGMSLESQTVIQANWSIQVVNNDGSKGAPFSIQSLMPYNQQNPVAFQKVEISVSSKDAIGNQASANKTLSVKLLGDYLFDTMQGIPLPEELVPPEELFGPKPPEWMGLVGIKTLGDNIENKLIFRNNDLIKNFIEREIRG
jgi:hypothetical protein